MLPVALVVVLVAGAVLIAIGSGRGDRPTGPGAPRAVGTTGAVDPGGALSTTLPTVAPAGVSWEPFGGTSLPVSRTAGPSSVRGGVASGYAHSPEGALIAVAQISLRAGYSSGRESWEPTIEQQFLPDAARDQLLAAIRAYEAGPQTATGGRLGRLAGFVYQSYSPDTAVIGLVYDAVVAGTTAYQVTTFTVRWVDGDWRMVAPPGASWASVSRRATDLSGVVTWAAA